MQFTNVFLATAYLFFTVAPMVAHAQCSPGDFKGRRMVLHNSEIGRIIGPKWPAAWRIREDRPGYVLANADEDNLVLTRSGENLGMAPFSPNPDFDQKFSVACEDCQATSATGYMGLQPCSPGDDSQTFEFKEEQEE
uniref:Uncharacterized protein n=1 Tax=Moniliophthora roreri TaxID=221103 RepID=A0A0W0GEY8_MONRR